MAVVNIFKLKLSRNFFKLGGSVRPLALERTASAAEELKKKVEGVVVTMMVVMHEL